VTGGLCDIDVCCGCIQSATRFSFEKTGGCRHEAVSFHLVDCILMIAATGIDESSLHYLGVAWWACFLMAFFMFGSCLSAGGVYSPESSALMLDGHHTITLVGTRQHILVLRPKSRNLHRRAVTPRIAARALIMCGPTALALDVAAGLRDAVDRRFSTTR